MLTYAVQCEKNIFYNQSKLSQYTMKCLLYIYLNTCDLLIVCL